MKNRTKISCRKDTLAHSVPCKDLYLRVPDLTLVAAVQTSHMAGSQICVSQHSKLRNQLLAVGRCF